MDKGAKKRVTTLLVSFFVWATVFSLFFYLIGLWSLLVYSLLRLLRLTYYGAVFAAKDESFRTGFATQQYLILTYLPAAHVVITLFLILLFSGEWLFYFSYFRLWFSDGATFQFWVKNIYAFIAYFFTTSALTAEVQRITPKEYQRVKSAWAFFARYTLLLVIPTVAIAGVLLACAYFHRPGWVAWPLASIAGVSTYFATYYAFLALPTAHVRGRKRGLKVEEAKRRAREKTAEGERTIYFGGIDLPGSREINHFVFIGTVEAGKSALIKLLMKDTLPRVGMVGSEHSEGYDTRALIYDVKGDAYTQLDGIELHTKPVNLNPFDKRAYAWSMAKDLTDPASALAIASILIYDRDKSNPFFTRATRSILSGVLKSLMIRFPAKWTFREVCQVMRDPNRIKETISATRETRHILKRYQDPETFANIMSTIGSYMEEYELIAALWDELEQEGKTISLSDWVNNKKGQIIILQKNPIAREAVDAIYAVMFARLSQLIEHQPDSDTRRTYLFLDELAEGVKFRGLREIALLTRSKGVSMILGFQDLEALGIVYTMEEARTILGMCSHKAFLRIESDVTQKWAAEQMGKAREKARSETFGKEYSVTEREEEVPIVMPSEFGDQPLANFTDGIPGWFYTPVVQGAWSYTVPGEYLRANIPPKNETTLNRDPRDKPADQYLRDLTSDEIVRLSLDLKRELEELQKEGLITEEEEELLEKLKAEESRQQSTERAEEIPDDDAGDDEENWSLKKNDRPSL